MAISPRFIGFKIRKPFPESSEKGLSSSLEGLNV
jgi:hypothetical protein